MKIASGSGSEAEPPEDMGKKHDFHDMKRDLDWVLGNYYSIHNLKLSFHQTLIYAMLRADTDNFVKLEREFPEHAHIVRSHKDPNYFLRV